MYNTVDSLVVGNFCGNEALAAVSSSGSLCHLIIGFFQGTFIGASVLISKSYGAQDKEGMDNAAHATVVFALIAGTILSILGVIFTPTILRLMGTPENVMPSSVTYFRIYCASLLALVLYNTATGIFQALGDSRHPLYYLIIASLLNVILDLLFVVIFDWGVAGAAFATALGQLLSALLAFAHLMSGKFVIRLSLKKLRFDPVLMKQVVRIGFPSGVQNCVVSLANIVVQSNINAFGDLAMAGCGSYSKIEGFVFLPIRSLNLALTTFVGQNLGAKQYTRTQKGAAIGTAMSMVFAELIGIIVFLFAPQLIGLFSSTPDVIAFGVRQIRVVTLFYCLLAFSHSASSILRGAGRTLIPMAVMLGDWCVFRIIYITVMVRMIPNISVVFTAYPVTWAISTLIFALFLKKSDWLHDSFSPLNHVS